MFERIVLVDELDGENLRIARYSTFFYALIVSASVSEQDEVAYQAYAPCPMVLETTSKGSSLGRGANCECAIMLNKNE